VLSKNFFSILKKTPSYCNAGVAVVNAAILGLDPGVDIHFSPMFYILELGQNLFKYLPTKGCVSYSRNFWIYYYVQSHNNTYIQLIAKCAAHARTYIRILA
jgi:hypothetical protein